MKQEYNNLSIGSQLQKLIKEYNLEEGFNNINVQDIWKKTMGDNISKYTEEISLKGSTLHIRLNSSVMREELSYNKDKIINALNDALGRIIVKKLVLR